MPERNPRSICISVVIPAYDEAERIGATARRIAEYLAHREEACEMLIVDDGSDDDTPNLLRSMAPTLPVPCRVLHYAENRGKGHALKVGFAHARGDCILFCDADLSTPIEEFDRLYERLESGFDVVFGSRKMPGAEVTVRQPIVRESLGWVFHKLSVVLIANVSDVTCGFKIFRGPVGKDLFARSRIDDWSFDAEILWLAKFRRYRLSEVPVEWHDEPGTKVSVLRDGWRSGFGLLRIRWNSFLGRYETPADSDQRVEELTPTPARDPGPSGNAVVGS